MANPTPTPALSTPATASVRARVPKGLQPSQPPVTAPTRAASSVPGAAYTRPAASGTSAAVNPYCSPWRRSTRRANASHTAKATTSHNQLSRSDVSAIGASPASARPNTAADAAPNAAATANIAVSPSRTRSPLTLASQPEARPGHGAARHDLRSRSVRAFPQLGNNAAAPALAVS